MFSNIFPLGHDLGSRTVREVEEVSADEVEVDSEAVEAGEASTRTSTRKTDQKTTTQLPETFKFKI